MNESDLTIDQVVGQTYTTEIPINQDIITSLNNHDGTLMMQFEYKLKENSPTFQGEGKFYRRYYDFVTGEVLGGDDTTTNLSQIYEDVAGTDVLKEYDEAEFYEGNYYDFFGQLMIMPLKVYIPSIPLSSLEGFGGDDYWKEFEHIIAINFRTVGWGGTEEETEETEEETGPRKIGDINNDDDVDVLDVVRLVNIVTDEAYNEWTDNDILWQVCNISVTPGEQEPQIDIGDIVLLSNAVENETDLGYV